MKKMNKDQIVSIIGVASGILSIIFSFAVLCFNTGYAEMDVSYGGDAYTGMQNASAQAANNIKYLADCMRFGIFAILFIAGLLAVCAFLMKWFKCEKVKNEEENVKASENESQE